MKFMTVILFSAFGVIGCSSSDSTDMDQVWKETTDKARAAACSSYESLVNVGMTQSAIVVLLMDTQGVDRETAENAVRIMKEDC